MHNGTWSSVVVGVLLSASVAGQPTIGSIGWTSGQFPPKFRVAGACGSQGSVVVLVPGQWNVQPAPLPVGWSICNCNGMTCGYSIEVTASAALGAGMYCYAQEVALSVCSIGAVVPQPPPAYSATLATSTLTLAGVPTTAFPAATQGFTLMSALTALGPPESGPFFGLYPDAFTFSILGFPATLGDVFHFIVSPATYPNTAFVVGPIPPLGVTLDLVEVLLTPSFTVVYVSNVVRISL